MFEPTSKTPASIECRELPRDTTEATLKPLPRFVGGFPAWNNKCAAGAAAMQRQWLDFVEHRVREDLALPVRLTGCRTPYDAFRTYASFLERMGDDYQKELTELTWLGTCIATETARTLQAEMIELAKSAAASRRQAT